MALDEALERVLRVYDKERLHPAPTEVIAQNLGYKSANNGSALAAIASLRYFGLLDRPKEGYLAVTKAVEEYKFAPEEGHRRSVMVGFLTKPQLYADLLEKFSSGLPSDANLRFDLIQRGFIPQAAEAALSVFKRSVEFVDYFNAENSISAREGELEPVAEAMTPSSIPSSPAGGTAPVRVDPQDVVLAESSEALDRIPVRLPGGRRAWLVIPMPFYEADKARLKAQIDLLLTEDE